MSIVFLRVLSVASSEVIFFYSVYDSRMVAAAQGLADTLKRFGRHISAQIHGDLAREYHILTTFLTGEVRRRDTKMFRYDINDELRRDLPHCVRRNQIF